MTESERCSCGSETKWHEPAPWEGTIFGWRECVGCGGAVARCRCPVFCASCQKPLFTGEANPCCTGADVLPGALTQKPGVA